MIYILHSGAELIEDAIKHSKYKDRIVPISPKLNSKVLRALRKIHIHSNLKSKKIWVDFLLKNKEPTNSNQNTVIIFDAPIWIKNIEYIVSRFKDFRIVFWFWNIVKDQNTISAIKKSCNNIYTFDKNDAEKHQFKYHPQFTWIDKPVNSSIIENDIFFVGRNKGRLAFLEKIYKICTDKEIKAKFYIVKDDKKDFSKTIELKDEPITYNDVIQEINRSKCILDINQSGQSGLTLRALEALFLKKKLITNNKDLVNYDFFKAENIQFLDEKSFFINRRFIDGKFLDVKSEIVENYTVDHWIETLING
ncbi:hypothetical protein [Sporomusa termitida]|uniref:Uncharacterized protein n=1 Tax=Sporomusa termitida TaxID=2377 RepID=A0A517DXP4_9FIRM|nr:hypothetical protein [Sporomusa termitida]QDR82016.1 hypothetical protein SPTER_34370 [Sporomusa termitida]